MKQRWIRNPRTSKRRTSGRHATRRPPRTILVFAGARALDGEDIGAGHDPVERCVVVQDALDAGAEVSEQLADLLLSRRQAPFRERTPARRPRTDP
jgi:hypothetical protein